MKMKSILHSFVATALIGIMLVLSNEVLAAPFLSSVADQYVPDEVLVKFKLAISAQTSRATVATLGGVVQANLNNNVLHVKLGANQTVAATVAAYKNDPNVEYAQPNYIYHATAAVEPDDTNFAQQWAFKNTGQTINNTLTQPALSPIYSANNPGTAGDDMNIQPAWGIITDCSSVVVAVVDTGVNYYQLDLVANMWNGNAKHGQNFASDVATGVGSDPMDLVGHGTHVAGIIGAVGNNNLGTTGVCWNASIMAVRVLDSTGSGTTLTITQGIDFAVTNGAKVINMSLGGSAGGGSSSTDLAFSAAITNAKDNDVVVVVVAAGNDTKDNDTTPVYPCNFTQPNLICVAALDQAYALASFSNWGATSVDVGAPGTNILSTWAGTATTLSDTLSAGWTLTPASGGWSYGTWTDTLDGIHNMLADPATWPTGTYLAGANDHIYKTFNLNGYDAAILNFYLGGVVNSGDTFTAAMAPAGGDPVESGTVLATGSLNSPTSFFPLGFNINACITTTCTLGFALTSAAASTAMGPAVTFFTIDTLTFNNTSYNTIDGTSMATPAVAGLATILRAYNPQYTYANVVAAIENADRATASLAKTTTGKAVDATASLAYINAPTGLTATVQ